MLTSRNSKHRRVDLGCEGLEDRKLLYATLGGQFVYGGRITYSFVPDGTNIGGNPSALFQTMSNRGFSTSQWQAAFQKAAAAWEAASNINLVQVADNGSSFGAAGNQQGDSHFGDIRIGGTSLASGVLASCFLPPTFNGGTLAGDMVFNTNQAWQINSDYDVQTVAIHEFGHALGLDHSSVSSADMYSTYNAQKQTLTSDDVAGIQAVYGARQPDSYDTTGNNSSANAASLTSLLNANGQASVPSLDITTANDCDWYVLTAPANTGGTLSVTMQSSNLSELSPKVLIYNGSLAGLASASAPNAFGATVTATVTGVTPGAKYYVKCMAANGGTTGIGSYGLLVNFGTGTMSPIPPPITTVLSVPDSGGGSTNEGAGKPGNGNHKGSDNDGSSDQGKVSIGDLTAEGDNLGIDVNFQRAIELVNSGFVSAETFTDPREAWTIQVLATIGHNTSTNTATGLALRAATIQAIDDILDHWRE